MPTAPFDAVVLTGGRGARLGGVPKADVVVAGATLLQRARAAVAAAGATVVVGREVRGGPVAAIEAGLARVHADVVVLLACDMPLVSAGTVGRLVDALDGAGTAGDAAEAADVGEVGDVGDVDGALLTDAGGRRQYLAGAYRTARLRDAVLSLGPTTDRSMRRLLEGLRLHDVPAQPDEAMDCDTWPDVARATELLEDR